jgi:uncharacterized protein
VGTLIRIILILVALWLVLGFVRQALERRRSRHGTATTEMVRCAHCGVHLPRDETIEHGGEIYCSEEHRRLGPGS